MFGYRFDVDDAFFTREQKLYLLMFVLLVIFALLARNIARSAVGRAFAAVRDRDIAAEVIGVGLTRYKVLAFALSSFYAGCAGALLYTVTGFFEPGSFNLLLSVQFIAMVLIGGVSTISGSIMGALFITLLPRLTRELPALVPFGQRPVDRRNQRLPDRGDPVRPADHRVPHRRTPRTVRDLGPGPELLEGVALLVLITAVKGRTNEAPHPPRPVRPPYSSSRSPPPAAGVAAAATPRPTSGSRKDACQRPSTPTTAASTSA